MLSTEQLASFHQNGYVVLENFISKETCDKLRKECDNIIESNNFVNEVNNMSVFTTEEDQPKVADMYFLTSTDKIRPFLEKKAKEIIAKSDPKDGIPKTIFNKIGHALHALNPTFKEATFDQRVKDTFKSIGYNKPIVCQSMYIFKQPFIGGEVTIHQDGTFLHVDPLKIAGVWIALEDCDLENGCLKFLPGSNKGPLTRRFIRNPNKEEFDKGNYLVFTAEEPVYNDDDFVPVPVKAGDAILIDGLVLHRSAPNFSPRSRHIYTFHVYESENATFSKDNWMEYSPISFLPLY